MTKPKEEKKVNWQKIEKYLELKDIFTQHAKIWLDEGGKNDVLEFAKWLDLHLYEKS